MLKPRILTQVVTPENINEIIAKLEENEHHSTTVQSVIDHITMNEVEAISELKGDDAFTTSPSIDVEMTLSHLNVSRTAAIAAAASKMHEHEISVSASADDGGGNIFEKERIEVSKKIKNLYGKCLIYHIIYIFLKKNAGMERRTFVKIQLMFRFIGENSSLIKDWKDFCKY